ncbi:hypothetical protein HCH_03579 [Hahella chejuensis KCTC 2396]|uniref:Uncharacterized protein n=1 Tax=Hahella chejuensis (strain KCTC 2396) TaxID=349521 RepID=Q2SGA3_HAHCH|nr:DUF6572 domain-containing protein [Hahella chejuensis]ABC30321.1 hypothetical protein HCH_03579 [Hahella chejuensis KCTC 2396]
MSLKNTDLIDVIAQSPHFDGYDIIAVDSGDIVDEIERYNLMIKKLSSYMEYIASGQVLENNPDMEGKNFRLCVLCKTEPNEAMLQVEALKTRTEPSFRFPVLVTTQQAYLEST